MSISGFCFRRIDEWIFKRERILLYIFLSSFNFLIYTFQARKIFAVGSNYFYTGRWGGFNSQFSPAFNVLTPMIFFTYNRFLTGLQTWKLWVKTKCSHKFIEKRFSTFFICQVICYLNTRQTVAKLNKYHSQRKSEIISIKFWYDSHIIPLSRYGNDMGISSAV